MEGVINQRIKSVLEDRQISISAFSKMIGMQQVTCNRQIRGDQAVSLGLIEGFLEKFDDISAEWLLRGEGSMYRKEESAGGVEEAISTNMVAEPAPTYRAQPEQDELLPVEWDGLPLCRITADGGVRYWQEDVATPERERACERATDLACTVREYMTLLEQAPPLQAQSLTGDYRLLADFNGTVLAAHPTRLGVHFVTWDWSCDRTGLNQGHYFQDNYTGAKQDFAIRAGLVSKQLIFNEAQLTEIYRCCTDTLDAGVDLTVDQEQCIKSVQEQILRGMPNILERMREQEQHSLDSQSQELTM